MPGFTLIELLVVLGIAAAAVGVAYWAVYGRTALRGQIFIVTKGAENIKLALVGVHIVPDDKFSRLAEEALAQFAAPEEATREANTKLLTQFREELQQVAQSGRMRTRPDFIEVLAKMESEAGNRAEAASASLARLPEEIEFSLQVGRLVGLLGTPQALTDADGKFSAKASDKDWFVASAERSVGEKTETYFWVFPIRVVEDKSSTLVVSNHLLTQPLQLRRVLELAAKQTVPAKPSAEFANWIREQRANVAKLESELAAPEVEAAKRREEALLRVRDSRLRLLAPHMERCGIPVETVRHTLLTGGTVIAWGDNTRGQSSVPEKLSGIVAVAAGEKHSLALKSNGTVVAWGDNSRGQARVPKGLDGVVAIAAGYWHNVAIKSDGSIVAWGDSSRGALEVPASIGQVRAIAAGKSSCLAVDHYGECHAWGHTYGNDIYKQMKSVVAVSAGIHHFMALSESGRVMLWGPPDGEGALMLHERQRLLHLPEEAQQGDLVAIAAGGEHSVALRRDGTITCWGSNLYGQCTAPAGLINATAISAGRFHSVALTKDGSIRSWGKNVPGAPNSVEGRYRLVAVAAGGQHNLALSLD